MLTQGGFPSYSLHFFCGVWILLLGSPRDGNTSCSIPGALSYQWEPCRLVLPCPRALFALLVACKFCCVYSDSSSSPHSEEMLFNSQWVGWRVRGGCGKSSSNPILSLCPQAWPFETQKLLPCFFAITAFCNESHNAKVGQNLGVLEIYLYLPVMVFTLFG